MAQLDDLLVDPPIVDDLRIEEESGGLVVTFVPSDELSSEPKLVVTIPVASVEGRQVQAWLEEFGRLLSEGGPVQRIVHGGGGDFTLSSGGAVHRLSDLESAVTVRIDQGLQYIARAAENAYRIVRVNLSRSA